MTEIDITNPEAVRLELGRLQANVSHWQGKASDSARNHKRDIATIGERLMEEANDRGWCDIYDTVINELNDKLTIELPVREQEYEVSVSYTVELKTTVMARNADEAKEDATSLFERDLDSLDHGQDYTCDEDWEFETE